ncbi:MAG: hypothetical protein ACOZNI_28680 [Myxococcota bacterium]
MHTLLLALFLAGCADPYGDAKTADTIEAWESFLQNGNPSASQRLSAEQRLEELLVARAEGSKKIEDYDAVLKKYPKSKNAKKMKEGRAAAAFAAAEAENTADGWKRFLDENDFADGALKKKARERVAVAEYGDKLAIGTVAVEQVNLAEDPKGPKDGWGFSAEIANNGDKTIEYLNMELQMLDASGAKLGAATQPAVGANKGGMPTAEEQLKPLAPGEKRKWSYSTGEVPEGWAEGKAVKLAPAAIRFGGGDAKTAADGG